MRYYLFKVKKQSGHPAEITWECPLCTALCSTGRLCLYRLNVDEFTSVASLCELNCSTDEGIQGVVLADTYIQTGMMYCSTLTFEDITGFGKLSTKNFYAEAFAF